MDMSVVGYEVLAGTGRLPRIINVPVASSLYWMTFYYLLPETIRPAYDVLDETQFISVNFFTHHVSNATVMDSLKKIAMFPDAHKHLVIEWVEKRGGDTRLASRKLHELRDRYGVRLAIDDAGEGEDAFGRMSMLYPDFIKISGKMIHQARTDAKIVHALSAISTMGMSLGASIIAEWIENEIDIQIALDIGAVAWQGFLDRKIVQKFSSGIVP